MRDPGPSFARLVAIMRTLRAPGGCPWDRQQTLASLRPYVLEETYELLEAIDRGDMAALCEELGDVLYEAVFLAQVAEEAGHFALADALDAIAGKLVRRHPHVFAPDGQPRAQGAGELSAGDVERRWEALKADEPRAAGGEPRSVLAGVPRTLPALLRAYELGARAAAAGFDWSGPVPVLDKIEEELVELRDAVANSGSASRRAEAELGDVFFALANLARKLGHEPEAALRQANARFQERFEWMERTARAEGRELRDLALDELEALWGRAKALAAGEGR